jgi:alpha-1,2-mannosyltransferase
MLEPAPTASRPWFPSRSVLLFVLGVVALWWLVLVTTPLWFNTFPRQSLPADFQLYFSAARIGLEQGWSHIYDFGLQRAEYYQVHPDSDPFGVQVLFVSAPPMAWLIAPLAATMPYAVAYWVFAGLLAAAYAVTAWWVTPGSYVTKAAVVLAGATTYPVLICVHMGQVALLVGVGVVAAWALLRRGHQIAAGLALSVIFLKPQVAYLVPLALLAWGAWRPVAVSAGAAAVLMGLSVLSLGGAGVAEFSHLLSMEGQNLDNQIWTPAILTGPGAPAYAVEVVAAAVALTVAFLARRRRDPGTAIVAGLVGSLLAAPYHHGADAFCLVAAFLISLNLKPSRLLAVWMAFGAAAALLEPPTGPLPLLIFAAGWLLLLLYEEIRGQRSEPNVGLVSERAPAPAPL